MTDAEGKSKRLRERIKLSLPARVTCRESAEYEWVEMTRLIDVTPFGASFMLTRPTEAGRLLHLILPLPRQLRCFDHAEDQYQVWSLVRRVRAVLPEGARNTAASRALLRFEVGVGFTGKYPPEGYREDPSTRYEANELSGESHLWTPREMARPAGEAADRRAAETRLRMAVPVTVEAFDHQGGVAERETTITENISRRGASILTSLKLGRGRFIRLTSSESNLSLTAVVRAMRTGADNIPRLHVEFVDGKWPLEGLQ